MSLKQEIGRRISQARHHAELSQLELADRTGLSKSRIGNYEQGTRTPGLEEARILAKALGVSASYLLCLDEESQLPPDEKALLSNYRASDPRGRDVIRRVAEAQPVYLDRDDTAVNK